MKKVNETNSATNLCSRTTSNGYEIYNDETSGEAVGVVYKNLVFLKIVSESPMNWDNAVEYCKTVVINGITAELCPVDDYYSWMKEFDKISKDLYEALKEIGAEKLEHGTWCSGCEDKKLYGAQSLYPYRQGFLAWVQSFVCIDQSFVCGNVIDDSKSSNYYVRPVLVLKR